jgi:hypothetical protein
MWERNLFVAAHTVPGSERLIPMALHHNISQID